LSDAGESFESVGLGRRNVVVLMDWQLANGDDGLALVNSWVAQGLPAERVIIVSGADDVPLHPYKVVTKSQAGALLVPTLLQMANKI
ncbi:MAG: hypothetical protein LW809_01735, partial [Vampirovibrionales bacterium]|nr:hypothetical protein [Vampirovibrionales bacterium]